MKGKRALAVALLEQSGLGRWLRAGRGTWHGLLVLNYHRIACSPEELIDPRSRLP